MNILVVSAVLPFPLHSGGQIRMYNILKRLSKRHTITLVSFIRDEHERDLAKHLDFCAHVHMVMRGRAWQPKYYTKAIVGKYPFLLATYDNPVMRRVLEDELRHGHFDLVHIEPFYVLPSLPKLTIPLVVSEHNVEYHVYDSYVRRFPMPLFKPFLMWDVMKLRSWERVAWRQANELTAVSKQDAGIMKEYLSHEVSVVPNGVDLRSFPFRKPVKRDNPTILFVGNFRWHPNVDAAKTLVYRIWPTVKAKAPKARLWIAGRDIPQDLRRNTLRVGGIIKEGIEHIAPVYRDADLLVASHATAGGTKFKMLEAMATGLPIITTKEGVAGLDMEENIQYVEAATPQEFTASIFRVLGDMAFAEMIARNARTLVETTYDWEHIARGLDATWKRAYAKR